MTVTPDVRSIIQRAGGPKPLHAKMAGLADCGMLEPGQVVSEKGIYSWHEIGIPERHWAAVRLLCDVTTTDLHLANERLRRSEKRLKERRAA